MQDGALRLDGYLQRFAVTLRLHNMQAAHKGALARGTYVAAIMKTRLHGYRRYELQQPPLGPKGMFEKTKETGQVRATIGEIYS